MENISEKIQKQLESLEIVIKNVADIKPDPENPKDHSDEQIEKLCRSMETAWTNPIIVDENNIVIAGHGRLMAAQKLKLDRVPCIVLTGLTEAEKIQLQIFDNKSGEMSIWNIDKLCIKIDQLRDMNADLDLTGFTEREISDIFDELNAQNSTDEENEKMDAVPATPVKPQTKLGDIWMIGRHKLICGDSTDMSVVGRLMDGVKPDIVFTDPPYGMGLNTDYSSMKSKLENKSNRLNGCNYESGAVDNFVPDMINMIMGLNTKEMFLWGANYYAELLPNKNNGSWFVWDKRSNDDTTIEKAKSSDKMYGSCFELCWSKNKHKQDIVRIKWAGLFGLSGVFDKKRYHPTQKPIALIIWFLDKYSQINNIVVDLFGGSGSTMIACEKTNRVCRMAELDPKYCDVIIRRFIDTFGGVAINQDGVEFKVD